VVIHGFRGRYDLPSLLRAKSSIFVGVVVVPPVKLPLVGASPPPPRLGDHGSVVFRVKKSNIIWTERGKLTARQTENK